MGKRHASDILQLDFEQVLHETEKAAFIQFKRHAVWFPKKTVLNWPEAKTTYLIKITWQFIEKNKLEFLEDYEVVINYKVPNSKEVIIRTKGQAQEIKQVTLNPLVNPKRKIDL